MPAPKPKHVVIDGSNLATEGRAIPSLAQLNDAVMAFMREYPSTVVTVVVDATFGHRIDAREVGDFDAAIVNNELVTPPAGAVGRGDGFVLTIAEKVGASVVSNDSYQEFQGDCPWLFDVGRLIGGKPVPHVGWVFVERQPVRPTGRLATKKTASRAVAPMPVPSAPPPSASRAAKTARKAAEPAKPAKKHIETTKATRKPAEPAREPAESAKKPIEPSKATRKAVVASTKAPDLPTKTTARTTSRAIPNDQNAFDAFVSRHKPGAQVRGTVTEYAAHGVYVTIGDVRAYLPLSRMADPAPRSARHHVKIGDSLSMVVDGYSPERRGIDVGVDGVPVAAVTASTREPVTDEPTPARKTQIRKK